MAEEQKQCLREANASRGTLVPTKPSLLHLKTSLHIAKQYWGARFLMLDCHLCVEISGQTSEAGSLDYYH